MTKKSAQDRPAKLPSAPILAIIGGGVLGLAVIAWPSPKQSRHFAQEFERHSPNRSTTEAGHGSILALLIPYVR